MQTKCTAIVFSVLTPLRWGERFWGNLCINRRAYEILDWTGLHPPIVVLVPLRREEEGRK